MLSLSKLLIDSALNLHKGRHGRPETEIILYNLGKFSQVIVDYEVINFTLKPNSKIYGFCAFLKYAGYPGGGVQIAAIGYSMNCDAYQLANKYMKAYFPDWCARYPVSLERPGRYLAVDNDTARRFRWNHAVLPDPDGISS